VKLFKKPKSPFYWYDFTVRGQRYRGSTLETKEARAGKIAGLKLVAALEGSDPLDRKTPTLREFSPRFLQCVKTARLEFDSQRYYRNGWRLLQTTSMHLRVRAFCGRSAALSPFVGSQAVAVDRFYWLSVSRFIFRNELVIQTMTPKKPF